MYNFINSQKLIPTNTNDTKLISEDVFSAIILEGTIAPYTVMRNLYNHTFITIFIVLCSFP